jgi:hypothetical protein
MSNSPGAAAIYPCGRLARRDFIHQIGGGFLGLALGAVWAVATLLVGFLVFARWEPLFAERA